MRRWTTDDSARCKSSPFVLICPRPFLYVGLCLPNSHCFSESLLQRNIRQILANNEIYRFSVCCNCVFCNLIGLQDFCSAAAGTKRNIGLRLEQIAPCVQTLQALESNRLQAGQAFTALSHKDGRSNNGLDSCELHDHLKNILHLDRQVFAQTHLENRWYSDFHNGYHREFNVHQYEYMRMTGSVYLHCHVCVLKTLKIVVSWL